jgi:hypothetical protein
MIQDIRGPVAVVPNCVSVPGRLLELASSHCSSGNCDQLHVYITYCRVLCQLRCNRSILQDSRFSDRRVGSASGRKLSPDGFDKLYFWVCTSPCRQCFSEASAN